MNRQCVSLVHLVDYVEPGGKKHEKGHTAFCSTCSTRSHQLHVTWLQVQWRFGLPHGKCQSHRRCVPNSTCHLSKRAASPSGIESWAGMDWTQRICVIAASQQCELSCAESLAWALGFLCLDAAKGCGLALKKWGTGTHPGCTLHVAVFAGFCLRLSLFQVCSSHMDSFLGSICQDSPASSQRKGATTHAMLVCPRSVVNVYLKYRILEG